jgi:hypothetical protein
MEKKKSGEEEEQRQRRDRNGGLKKGKGRVGKGEKGG